MKYDYVTFYNKVSGVFRARPRLVSGIRIFNKVCTLLFCLAYGAFLAFAVVKKFAPIALVRILGAPALCLFLVTVLRYVINRPRPYSERGAGITPLHEKKKQDQSFPSRHVASAFAIALTILPYAVWAGVGLLVLACLVAIVRFVLGLHYPSDLFAGGLVGILCGLAGIFF